MNDEITSRSPKQFLFCFFAAYFVLNIFDMVFAILLSPLIFATAEPIFGITYAFDANGHGSGDTTYHYLQTFWHLIFALLLAYPLLRWLQKTNKIRVVYYLFIFLLRISVGVIILIYGVSKIFPSQFPEISLLRLSQPYGESSPMGLAWTFMQYSPAYSAFTGFAEILGGILLLWRKTSTIGGLILLGVLSNVVMMNFCYDIPVKLGSLHLLLSVILILASDRKRILDFAMNRTSQTKYEPPIFADPKARRILFFVSSGIKALIIVVIFSGFIFMQFQKSGKEDPLMGSYDVLNPAECSYSNITFDYSRASFRDVKNVEAMYSATIDTLNKTVAFAERDSTAWKKFNYTITKDGLVLTSDSLKFKLKRKTRDDFRLMNRGFHWINESPYNR